MGRRQRKVPFRVSDGGSRHGKYMARNAGHAVSMFRKQFDLAVDTKHPDPVWHGLLVSAVNEVMHYPK